MLKADILALSDLFTTVATDLPYAFIVAQIDENVNSIYGFRVKLQGILINFADAPLYFVRSGVVGISSSKLWYSGQDGYDWSSIPRPDAYNAYYLFFNNSGVYPSYNYDRFYGFPLRCLAS